MYDYGSVMDVTTRYMCKSRLDSILHGITGEFGEFSWYEYCIPGIPRLLLEDIM